ncbi:MAG: TonB-dependent receptor [Proteiniphilum sp.]|uniref:TonB-dependent receptor n=1 Tax=Proteiniphilum sp. TaxID=1926877 RepID=UPI00267F1FE2|nr:TonB-dependent receptor [Proteiniphilum sp.]MEA5126693.1 TonB-dependent receptor [Proteiniphilum sp.]
MRKLVMNSLILFMFGWLSIGIVYADAQQVDFPHERLSERLGKMNERGRSTGQAVTYDKNRLKEVYIPAFTPQTNNMEEWLYRSLENTNYTYEKTDNKHYTVVTRKSAPVVPPVEEPRDGILAGKVVDESGSELPGATVRIAGREQGTATGLNGDYSLSLPAGTYTIEVGFIGYDTQRVTDVKIEGGKTTPLTVALNMASTELGEVVITADYRKSSTAGALRIQQNMPQVSTVMAAEQIGKTSDKNLGEALKRITGVSTIDNKYVAVRGMGERWNEASLDGVTLPSTEANSKAFGFDLIPTNIIDNVTVVKTATPDMNANFAGGFVQVTTKDIPSENFVSLQVGGSYNSLSTGKDQYGRERGSLDWLGFDNGRRTFPSNTISLPKQMNQMAEQHYAQTYRFAEMGENFSLHKSRTPLSQNYQFSMGRVSHLDTGTGDRFGWVASLSYRNTQQQTVIDHQGRGNWLDEKSYDAATGEFIDRGNRNSGHIYKYGTVLGGIFNAGWQTGDNRLSFRNTYTRKFDDDLMFITGWDNSYMYGEGQAPNQIHINYPTFQDLLQNKLEGQHRLGPVKLNWDLAHTFIKRDQKDAVNTQKWGSYIDGELFFTQVLTDGDKYSTTRRHYENNERDWNWGLSAEIPFRLGEQVANTAKTGYMGVYKGNSFLFEEAQYEKVAAGQGAAADYENLTLEQKVNPLYMTRYGYAWHIRGWEGGKSTYEASVTQHAPYLMFDHRYKTLVRLVWGMRAEYYGYEEISNPYVVDAMSNAAIDSTRADKKWQWMPSANLTVTPIENFNIRLAYSRSVVRPQFMERTFFRLYDPVLSGYSFSKGLVSTVVDGADLKLEWYPGAGEIVSAGVFYRYLDKPIERIRDFSSSTTGYYYLQNNDWAKNYGMEFELRKNFAFIADIAALRNLYLYGNATFTRSKVMALRDVYESVTDPETGEGKTVLAERIPIEFTRPLYGQVPYMYNIGLTYEGERLGLNVAANHTGRKVFMLGGEFANFGTEYEAANTLLDAQVSYTLSRAGITFKLSGNNLLDTKTIFYKNNSSDYGRNEDGTVGNTLLPGKSEGYDKGHDLIEYQTRSGRSYSFSANWTF